MRLPIFVVDAFASGPFTGNPAAVVPCEEPLAEPLMRSIALEMKHSETAFVRARPDGAYDLRWFTPEVEVDLCGHATLATAHVLFEELGQGAAAALRFETRSGALFASRTDTGLISLDLPASELASCQAPAGLLEALALGPREVLRTRFDYLVLVQSEAQVAALAPDFRALRGLGVRGVMVTAPSQSGELDFVSRFFAPGSGIDEDPVTGSAHCALGPFWAQRLGRTELRARQCSARGGELALQVEGARVHIAGRGVTTLEGTLRV